MKMLAVRALSLHSSAILRVRDATAQGYKNVNLHPMADTTATPNSERTIFIILLGILLRRR